MPINTDLNIAPYFDDFDLEKQFYKILFKPAYAVQARELTQLQTILQNQIEQFGDNIYQEGTIIKGCSFTTLNGLQFVKLANVDGFDVLSYISGPSTEVISGVTTDIDVVYEIDGASSGLKASIVYAARGFETRPPDLNTFFINYLTTNEAASNKTFTPGEVLTINRYKYNGSTLYSTELAIATINVTLQSPAVGSAFGIQAASGVIFQKGHFLFANNQTLIVSKYTDQPDDISVGYEVSESLVTSLQDNSLYDNANGSSNENAPGADRLKLIPVLVAKSTAVADIDPNFFTLIRYQNGSAVSLRDVTQFNSIAEEMARRTYEESGNYIVDRFKMDFDRRDGQLTALIGKGSAYVKGYRVENSGKVDFTIEQVSSTAIQQNEATTVDYGSYVDITDISGTINLEYDSVVLQNAATTPIGTAFVKNITPTKLYLFGVKMDTSNTSFSEVTRVIGTSGAITIPANSTLKEVKKSPMIFNTGTSYLKSTTDLIVPQRLSTEVAVSANTIVLTGSGWDFGLDQNDLVVVDASNTLIPVESFVKSGSNSTLTITLAADSDPVATVYFNSRLSSAVTPYNKVVKTPYVKINYTSTTTKYSLGFPDTYKILDVYDASGTRYTDSFKLNDNQNDHFYDISYMEYIPGRPQPANGVLTIQVACFQLNKSTGSYFFSINSYPVDDISTTLPSDKIRSSDIGTFKSTNGINYNLRESFDFRPHADVDAVVDYEDSASSAGVVTTPVGGYTNVFTGTDYLIPPLDSNVVADLEFYLSRIDVLTMSSYGVLALIKGEEAEIPAAPKVSADELIVSEITIPGYPALSPKEASEQSKPQCAIRLTPKGTKNYTMRDIEKIEKRIEGLEYYVSLNQLEQQTENMLILDENGLTRFKNGYIVDPFNDGGVANLNDPNYKAAIHFDKSILTPALNTFPLDLKYKTSTNASIFPSIGSPEIATLSRNAHVKLLGQPYATNFRNCASNFWKYSGQVYISPDSDMLPSVTQNPSPINLDIASAFQELNELFPMTGTDWSGNIIDGESTTTTGRTGGLFGFFRRRTTTTTTQLLEQGTINNLVVNGGQSDVGDFVSNVDFQPYMRSRDINVYITGLRPDTRHYFFFDNVAINQHVWNGTNVDHPRDMQKIGVAGASVTTDSNGILRGVFTIPEGAFFVGDRVLRVADVATLGDIDSASTSTGEITYHAYNITVEKNTLSTRMPEFEIAREATTRNVGARSVTTRNDPLAQTFFIKDGMGRGSNTVFISKIDLYFKRKSEINGVTITLREVINGYPSGEILPFSKIHLTPSQVNVSDDASAITTVDFTAPVRMDVEKEYAVVIMPDASDPSYLHFTSKVGGVDLTPGETNGQAVVQDWGDGVLFTSTNNRAWKSYQDEDIKFTLYRHDFNAAVGTVTLTNDDHEFFTLSDWDGRFNQEEIVYKENAVGYTVSVIADTNVVTTSGNNFETDYANGDYILITSGTDSDIFKIGSVDSSTTMTLTKPCSFTAAGATGTSITAGIVSHYNRFNRSEMHLKKSSARTSKVFGAGDTLTGFTSGTTGTIGSINNINLSYIQPMVMKSNDSVTTTAMNGLFNSAVDPLGLDNYVLPMKFGDNNSFTGKGVVVYSKSNNLVSPKPFDINVDMGNKSNSTSTPVVDVELSSILAYQYKVTNTAATSSRYISKTIELAADLDADDMEIFLTGYRPNGTNIKVFIKPQHAQDAVSFDTIDWIELELTQGLNTYSSSSNLSDYREFKYVVAEANKDVNGVLQYASTGGTFSSYRKFAIKIELLSPNIHNSPTVKDYRGIALT